MTPSIFPLLATTLLLMTLSSSPSRAASREGAWKTVEDAAKQGQPRTALERLQPILDQAQAEKAWPEAVRAIGRKVALEAEIQGQLPEERIVRLAAETKVAPAPLQPYLHHLLARAYWTYFQQNRWRVQQRTAIAPPPGARPDPAGAGDDFRTWDLRRLFSEIDRQFTLALADARALQSTPITSQDALLERGSIADRYRPSLFDFLIHDALEFYSAGEQAGARPEDAFVVESASPILSDATEFLGWIPPTTDTNSPAYRAIQLHQAALRFHERDADPAAFREADLARLIYARNVAVGEDRDARFVNAVQALAQRAADDEISSRIRHEWAAALQRLDRLTEAHAVATEGARAFPQSPGAAACRNLIRSLEARSLRLSTERTWLDPHPPLEIAYRNLTRVHFRAVRVEWDRFLDRRQPRPDNLRPEQRLEFMRRPAAAEWSLDIPPTPDFLERVVDARPPATVKLAPGYYLLFASARPDFLEPENVLAMAEVWVTDLALVVRPRAGKLEGFVLDARSGEPVSGATVEAWELRPNAERSLSGKTLTDDLGFFAFPDRPASRSALLRARKGDRQVALPQDIWLGGDRSREQEQRETLFFTDRALYRPGQLIQYKGICLSRNVTNDNYRLLPGLDVVVVFTDSNGKEVARQTRRANDYGSFAGTFTAPTDRMPGDMHLEAMRPARGGASFQVEEYKRPKFQVALDAPKSAPRLADDVTVTGHATAYTGAAIDGAEVRWQVTRIVRFPAWWGWFRGAWPSRAESQEIAHGTSRTDVAGVFPISFKAIPDRAVAEKDEPTFEYAVHADVTDGAGETRSGDRSVRVGYTALQATLAAADWQVAGRPVELRVDTLSLDGEGQPAAGTIAIHRVKQPADVPTPRLTGAQPHHERRGGPRPPAPDPADPNQWELGEVVTQIDFRTDAGGHQTNQLTLAAGLYRAVLETRDRFGKTVTARLPLHVLDPRAPRLTTKLPFLLASPAWTVEPGDTLEALWGTGYDTGRAFVEIEDRDRVVERYWTPPGRTQATVQRAVTEAMRGGFTLHITQVRDNRAHLESRFVDVPWSQKELELSWETFRSRLEPGAKETWTAVIRRRAGVAHAARPLEATVAEMVATLYDASLDQFMPHDWRRRFEIFPQRRSTAYNQFSNGPEPFQLFSTRWETPFEAADVSHRHWPAELLAHFAPPIVNFMRGMAASATMAVSGFAPTSAMAMSADASAMQPKLAARYGLAGAVADRSELALAAGGGGGPGATKPTPPAPATVTPRRNLSETAFFLPHLLSDSNGVVRVTFTLPEALTEWRFLGFAHDREMRSGFLAGKTVSARDLMLQPNPPRFLREGDEIEFTVKLSNQSDTRQTGRAQLVFAFAQDSASADQALGNTRAEQAFDLPARESRTLSWKIAVPDGCGFLTYKATASTGSLSDGEDGFLPVLSRRVHLTESLPLNVRGPGEKKFTFESLAKGARSRTLRHDRVTVQMVSNPAWYAVMALPYLMEFPHECAEQTFNRLYANAIARNLAVRDPRIKAVFDQWRATPALDSPLARNQDLKSLLIEETPWLRQSDDESQARRNVALLFEGNRLEAELARAQQRLAELQLPEGGWPWFPGGPRNEFITLYIVTGFGRLRHLGVDFPVAQAVQAIPALDAWIHERFQRLGPTERNQHNLDATVALYLYGRSFFLKDQPVAEPHGAAVEYYLAQARQHWVKHDRQTQGHLALALQRFDPTTTNKASAETLQLIVRSLRERSVSSEEMGMFWRDTELGGWWYRAPIETQALMIEVFDEVARDPKAVEDLKVWLLKQKQTRDWKTTKATADAVYALLGRGTDLLASSRLVEVELGGRSVTPGSTNPRGSRPRTEEPRDNRTPAVEPGTGFYEVRIPAAEVKPALADIHVRKLDAGIAWGGVHWQYFEDLSAVKPFEGSPLKLKKDLFLRDRTKAGAVLQPAQGRARVGDELVVRLELRVDRDLEFVHLKDQRGSGTEPVNVISGRRFQDGLGYYESTRDTASHFFIDYLPKGTYVFEYPVRVQLRGEYTAGVATVQCLYAPEFNSHSQGFRLRVE